MSRPLVRTPAYTPDRHRPATFVWTPNPSNRLLRGAILVNPASFDGEILREAVRTEQYRADGDPGALAVLNAIVGYLAPGKANTRPTPLTVIAGRDLNLVLDGLFRLASEKTDMGARALILEQNLVRQAGTQREQYSAPQLPAQPIAERLALRPS